MSDWLLVKDVARLKSVTPEAVYAAIWSGRITAVKIGSQYAVRNEQGQRYLQMLRGRKSGKGVNGNGKRAR